MHFCNRRQKLVAVWMSVWLCSWIGIGLLHGILHATQADSHPRSPCVACRLLHQPAPAKLDFSFAPRAVRFFECVREIRAETSLHRAQIFTAAISPRGPPALLFV
jgi:hypothetical protein